MIENQNFVVFSDDWGRHPSSCQHIFKRLAAKNKVLWVNTIGMRLPSFNKKDCKRVFEKIVSWVRFDGRNNHNNNLIVYSPVMAPVYDISFFRKANDFLLTRGINRKLKKYNMSNPFLVTTIPVVSGLVGSLNERASIYYCVDDFAKWPGLLKEPLDIMEKELLAKVDLILATSGKLCEQKKSNRCPTHLLSHGVDLEHFNKCEPEAIKIPQGIKKPIIGYFGLFDERIDFEILSYILSAHPEWSLTVVGETVVDVSSLKRYKNIHFLGPVSYDMLPNYAWAFDVCILPYLVNDLTVNINPLKLKEYLAMGKPVVTTRLPEAEKYGDIIKIADSKREFMEAIQACLEDKDIELKKKRQSSVLNESWEAKAEEFSRYLKEIPEKKINIMHLRSITASGGGPEKTILLSGQRVDKDKFNMVVVYLRDEKDSNPDIINKAREKDLTLYELLEKTKIDRKVIKKLRELLERYQIDILHCHDYKSDILGFILSKSYPVKLVTTIHGWVGTSLKEKFYYLLDKKVIRYFDRVIPVYEGMNRYLLNLGIPVKKLKTIHNAIDAEDFKKTPGLLDIRSELNLGAETPIIGAIGRLSKEKNLKTLLSIAKNVASEIKNAKLLIVGEGPEKENLKTSAKKLGIEKMVIFLGQRKDVKNIYNTLDLLLSTSIKEGLPNVILEALAMEVPVIATKVGGVGEIVEDNVNGLLFQPTDVNGIAKGAIRLLKDTRTASNFAREGRKVICERFSFGKRMKKMERLYLEVMGMLK